MKTFLASLFCVMPVLGDAATQGAYNPQQVMAYSQAPGVHGSFLRCRARS